MLIVKPRKQMSADEIVRLIFGKDTTQIKSGYDSTGWFRELIKMMKGEFEVGSVNRKGMLCYVITSGINFEFEAEDFNEYYDVEKKEEEKC